MSKPKWIRRGMTKLQAHHQSVTLTPKQQRRLVSGNLESQPSDYSVTADPEAIAARDARHRLEDRRIAKELGI